MKIAELGRLSGPVIAYGGALGNLAALEALFAAARAAGVAADHVVSTGDIAGYGAQGADCVAATRAFRGPVVAGNVERQLAAGAGDCGCGFGAGSACDLLSAGWWAHADATIGQAARDWMARLPDMAVFEHEGRRFAVVHGGLTDISRFLWPSSSEDAFREEIAAIEAVAGRVDAVIAGHCGLAFERVIGAVSWINAGVIGMPPHDGRPGGRYVRLDADGARILRLDYDPAPAVAAMAAAGLVQGYEKALETGLWPSEDVLPEAMRRGR